MARIDTAKIIEERDGRDCGLGSMGAGHDSDSVSVWAGVAATGFGSGVEVVCGDFVGRNYWCSSG